MIENKKIKVLRIIARLNIGGPAIHTILLTEGLNNQNFESILACGTPEKNEGDMSYYASEKGVSVHLIPELKRELNFTNDIRSLLKIYSMIKREEPDIIHTHTAKAGSLGRSAGILYNLLHPFRKNRIQLIHTFHGHVLSGYFGKAKSGLFILLESILACFSRKIIAVSKSVKEQLLKLRITREDRIQVIPLGFELDSFLKVMPRQGESFNIGIVGRLVPIKNQRLFLDAAELLIREPRDRPLKFRIVGDGELRQYLRDYTAKHNLSDYVDFLGWQKELDKIYTELDLVTLTSINEGTPVSLIEAMASGRAVISTNAGGVKDLLGEQNHHFSEPNLQVRERGVLLESADPADFASAVTLLLKNSKLRTQMGLSGRQFTRDNFSKERLLKDTEFLYKSII